MAKTTDDILDPSDENDRALMAMQRRLDAAGGASLDPGLGGDTPNLQVPVPQAPDATSAAGALTGQYGPMATREPTNTGEATYGMDEHTPSGQELLGHAGGPNLGDYNNFANDVTGTQPQRFIGDALAGAASSLNDALGRRLAELQNANNGSGASSTPDGTTPSGQTNTLGPITQGAIDAQNKARAGANDVASSTGTDTGPGGQPTSTGSVTTTTAPGFNAQGVFTGGGASSSAAGTTGAGSTGSAPTNYGDLLSHPQTAGGSGGSGAGAGSGSSVGAEPAGAGSGQISGGASTGGAIDLGGFLGQLNQITSAINGNTPTDATAVYVSGLQSILDMLGQQEQQLRADAASGKVVDPQTQQALDTLTKNLQGSLDRTREDLNRRGLYESGILLDLESKLRTGNASDQATVLNDRLARMQSDLQKGLSQIGQNRFSAANDFYGSAAKAQTSSDELTRKLRADLVGQKMGAEAARQAADAARQFQAQQSAQQRTYDAAQAEAARQNAIYLEQLRLSGARGTGGGTGAGTGDGSGPRTVTTGTGKYTGPNINGYPVVAGEGNAYGGSTSTGNNVSPVATNAAISALSRAMDRTHAITDFANAYNDLIAKKVDVQAVADAIDRQFPPSSDAVRGNRTIGGPI